jgi:hypothetical protein
MEVVKASRKVVAGCVKGKAYTETELLQSIWIDTAHRSLSRKAYGGN